MSRWKAPSFSMGRLSDRVASYAGHAGTLGDWGAQAERVRNMTYDDWVRDKVAYGTPDAVSEKLNLLGEELGLDQVMFEINYGNLIPLENQANSLRLMMEEVRAEPGLTYTTGADSLSLHTGEGQGMRVNPRRSGNDGGEEERYELRSV